ncbi:MAG: hypothetical protein IJA86_00965, partial [Clostridia bacterium]|nr:hypothetical protein [Clostridia bacterium]
LKYGKETVEFPVEVVDIASIEMVSTPAAGTVFEVGDLADGFGALANDNNVKVKVNYTDGSSTEDLVNANFQFRGSFKEAGTSTVTVYYYGKSTSFDINLIQVSDIEITPKKTYRYGNSPKIGDFDINFIYSDGSKLKSDDDNVAIELTYNEDDLKQYITKTPGKMSIEIKATNADYNLSFTKTVEIEVETPIRVDVTAPKKAEYMQGETFEADGLKVQLVYDNKGKEAKVEFKKEDYTYNASTRVPAEGKNIRIKTDIPGLKEIFDDNKVGFTMTIKADPNQTTESTPPPADPGNKPKDDFNWIPVIVIAAIVVVGAGTAVVVIVIKKKKN